MKKKPQPVSRFPTQADWLVVGWVLLMKVSLVLFGAVAFRLWQNRALFGLHSRLEIWNRWNAISYLELAQFGYRPPGTLRQFSVAYFLSIPGSFALAAI